MSDIIWTDDRKAKALASCKKWEGTPHKNRLAIHGVGIDCIQFVNEILIDAGIIERRRLTGYNVQEGMFHVSNVLKTGLTGSLNTEEITEPEFGAVVIFSTGITSGHCGFITDGPELWHSIANHRVMHGKWELWRHRVQALYRITALGLKADPNKFTKI